MKLYTFPSAPSPQRVHLFMKEKGIDIESQLIDMRAGEHLGEAFKKINPRMTVPALQLDDGTTISEVIAILHYLETAYPETPLFGTTAKEKAVITEWEHRIESECFMGIAEALRNRGDAFKNRALPGPLDLAQIPELVDRGRLRTSVFFEVLNQQLENNEYVAGDQFSVADITATVAVNFSKWIKIELPEQLIHLHAWRERMMSPDRKMNQ